MGKESIKSKTDMRRKLLNWLRQIVFKVPANVKYDPAMDIYTIKGYKISGDYFDMLFDQANEGQCFQLMTVEDDLITLRMIDNDKISYSVTFNEEINDLSHNGNKL